MFEGTVHVCTAEELIDLQGRDIDPSMVSGGGTYAVLVFNSPVDVEGMGADGSGKRTKTSSMLGIAEYTNYGSFVTDYGNLDSWRKYNGKQVTLAARADDITFPSDVRLPIGEPWSDSATVLS